MTAPAVNDCDNGPETTGETTGVVRIPQPHGGALNSGGTKGNRGGRGATPSRIRAALRRDFVAEARPLLRSTIRGDYVHKMRVPLLALLEHALCPECDGKMGAREPEKAAFVEIDVQASAPIGERRKAAEAIAKYGLGESTTIEVIHPEVIQRIQGTVQAIQDMPGLSIEQREQLLDAIEAVWA